MQKLTARITSMRWFGDLVTTLFFKKETFDIIYSNKCYETDLLRTM